MRLFKRNKIFCISFQRTGTTSVGEFFEEYGYKRAGWSETHRNDWNLQYFKGDYNAIFDSKDFKQNTVFEDGPWSLEDFYKVLYHQFPKSKFVLFTRDPDKWFDSMMSHSNGKTLGNTFRHCYLYGRETEFYESFQGEIDFLSSEIDNLLPLSEEHREKYIETYVNRNYHAIQFFNAIDPLNERFIHCELEDQNKWSLLADFFDIEISENYDVHANKSK